MTDARSAKEHEIERNPQLCLTFTHQQTNTFLAISALGAVSSDIATIEEYWRQTDSLWWEGPTDPNVCVVRAQLLSASLWDGPSSKAAELFEFIKAKITGGEPNLGENREVNVFLGVR